MGLIWSDTKHIDKFRNILENSTNQFRWSA
nr:MAG TPA: hypothetical protein [Caudoviricetes sp.]